ncbi:DNA polymerase III PolC-type-like [Girardinichthys multiradiatus]|uniref:DNA polymerase III PolC-type-like n=1 Tax=Girardinichthys multiradiatus TaxID=208333 RepID=UPI001FAC2A46|nr:DNA polymerase III PolC-type-like [Girardinichthys multiradiatus]XP_047210603.1 DNA polymerase III PolC-type-like [Girardinichthys multiradiatus]
MADNEIIVFFDLETTGLDTSVCDIIQLAAVCGERVFNKYTLPRRVPNRSATAVTGFTVTPDGLFLHGDPVKTIPLDELLTTFITFLRTFRCPIVLAAHNARRFDEPVLSRVLRQCSLQQEFQQVVSGFLDTFLLSKNLYQRLASYSQESLVWHFLGRSYNAHNAVEDARMLQELYQVWSPNRNSVLTFTYRAN